MRNASGTPRSVLVLLVAASGVGAPLPTFAQEFTIGRDIPIAIAIPPHLEDLGPAVAGQMEARLAQLATASGMAAVEGFSNVVLYPLVVVTDEERTSGLIEDVTLIRMEVSLFIKNVADGTVFASISRTVTGSGRNYDAALRNAVRELTGRDPALRDFVRDARSSIVNHYIRTCDTTIADARAAAAGGNVQEGIALLLAVPGDAQSCHDRTRTEAIALYDAHQSQICEEMLRRARAEIAVDRFGDAIDELEAIDANGPCARRADDLIDSIEGDVRAGAEARFELRIERYRAVTGRIRGSASTERSASTEKGGEDDGHTLAIARVEAFAAFNRPQAKEFPPGFFRARS